MSVSSAPEARGPGLRTQFRLASWVGLPVCICLSAYAFAETSADLFRNPSKISKPGFALADIDGGRHALAGGSSRVVLVHFWATWCEPCRAELTSLSKLVEHDAGVKVLAVNVAEPPVRVRRFLATTPVEFPVLLDETRAVTRAWGVGVLPTTFVLDRELTVHRVAERDIDWLQPDVLATLAEIARAPRREPNADNQQGEERHVDQ